MCDSASSRLTPFSHRDESQDALHPCPHVWCQSDTEQLAITGAVCSTLSGRLRTLSERAGSLVIYGESFDLGLLGRIAADVGCLLLGRFVHDPSALGTILNEVLAATTAHHRI